MAALVVLFLLAMPSPVFAQTNPIECFCVTYIRQFIPDLPRQDAKDFVPNTVPQNGAVAIYRYWNEDTKTFTYHVGYMAYIINGGWIEYGTNLTSCTPYVRFVRNNPNLIGFFIPLDHGLPAIADVQ